MLLKRNPRVTPAASAAIAPYRSLLDRYRSRNASPEFHQRFIDERSNHARNVRFEPDRGVDLIAVAPFLAKFNVGSLDTDRRYSTELFDKYSTCLRNRREFSSLVQGRRPFFGEHGTRGCNDEKIYEIFVRASSLKTESTSTLDSYVGVARVLENTRKYSRWLPPGQESASSTNETNHRDRVTQMLVELAVKRAPSLIFHSCFSYISYAAAIRFRIPSGRPSRPGTAARTSKVYGSYFLFNADVGPTAGDSTRLCALHVLCSPLRGRDPSLSVVWFSTVFIARVRLGSSQDRPDVSPVWRPPVREIGASRFANSCIS